MKSFRNVQETGLSPENGIAILNSWSQGRVISRCSGTEPAHLPRSHEKAAEIGPRCSSVIVSVISKCYNNTQKYSYHELKEMDSASDASELPPLYHGLIHCDQCLHGTLPGKIQMALSIPKR